MASSETPARRYPDTPFLEDAAARMVRSRAVHGAILCVESGDGRLAWRGAAGNLQADRRYFFGKGPDGKRSADALLGGQDEAWPLERIVERVRTLKPRFVPGKRGRVHYSDTNYELLGHVIEAITGQRIADVFRELIFDELGLRDTYAFSDPQDGTPAPMMYRDQPVHVPRYIASITAEGGIVSTAPEVMTFLKAFFTGRFFPRETVQELKQWNRIYFPGQFDFGIGLEKQWVPWIMSPLNPIGELLGFWGQSGAFAFHNPQRDLYFTGTVNQLSGFGHGAAVSAMVRIMKAVR